MEYRTLDINVMSARDIKDVNLFSKMDVYVVVSVTGDRSGSTQKAKTEVDRAGGKNPAWNCPMKFTIPESAARQGKLALVFKLRCERSLGDRDIGEVVVPIEELMDSSPKGDERSIQTVTYQVRKPSGKPKGELNFSYKFGDLVNGQEQLPPPPPAVTAYPAQAGPSAPYKSEIGVPPPVGYPTASPSGYPAGYPPPAAAVYPPPPPPTEYAYPPPYGGYPPPPPQGYVYPPPPPPPGYGYQETRKKSKFGMGLGAGLLGGALGGLLIGDMVSDAGDFGDCGGF